MASMDYVFRITDQTSGTVTLTSSPYAYLTGGVITADREARTVGETMEFRVQDGAGTANLDELHTLNRLLKQAEDAQGNRALNKVYLTWQTGASADVWRSEIIKGRAEPRSDALTYGYWSNDTMFAPVYLERKNYWEGAEVQLALTNPNGTATTDALAVLNSNDAGGTAPALRVNYVDIAGTAVLGDLPGATRLEMTNSGGTVQTYRPAVIWIGQNYTNPATYTYLYEGEAGTVTGGTATSAATMSGGYYATSGAFTGANVVMYRWSIPSAVSVAAAGRPFHAVMKMTSSTYNASKYYRLRILSDIGSGVTEWTGPAVYIGPSTGYLILDLGLLYLPPNLSTAGIADYKLELVGSQVGTDTSGLGIDYLMLLPADGWRVLQPSLLSNTFRLVDDGINENVYIDNGSGTGKFGGSAGEGKQIMLQPGKDQRLYFLMQSAVTGNAPIDMKLGVKLHYRPRRLTL